MQGFARWIMQSTPRAVGVALLGSLVPWLFWLSAAVSALVTLRRGLGPASPVVLAAALPAGWWWMQGDAIPLASILLVTVMAIILRERFRWGETLLAGAIVVAVLIQIGIFAPPDASQLIEEVRAQAPEIDELLRQYASQGVPVERLAILMISAVTGLMVMLAATACLALARSWQAALYNPGGFRDEFHRFRLSRLELAGVVLMTAVGFLGALPGAILMAWVPLLVAGIALVHGVVGVKSMRGFWLVGFYALLLTTWPTLVIVLLLALIDTFADFRTRLIGSQR
ncbi:hypothetical protein [Kushneria marisflavi]|uniref:Uncharacterized protein n=1 Tax=Kushneria marisflavi TaxID=157779 RepID=A0A240UM44_9GAMM|nr:hypothetical protein [Kushneria marisflavi]ART62196.1 hypothetical protein B9H00_03130 [Kushneria marisflavi]RKD87279.1 hypothetical protein C8D96_0739 [Kushneria marisflavi]